MSDKLIAHPFEATGVSVGGVLTTLLTILPSDVTAIASSVKMGVLHGLVQFEVENTGAQALTDFAIEQQDHVNAAEWYSYLAAGDWVLANTDSRVLSVSAVLNALASGAKGHATVALHAATQIRFAAKRAGLGTTVNIRGMLLLQQTL